MATLHLGTNWCGIRISFSCDRRQLHSAGISLRQPPQVAGLSLCSYPTRPMPSNRANSLGSLPFSELSSARVSVSFGGERFGVADQVLAILGQHQSVSDQA